MTIHRGQDNKGLRDVSGEVLIEPNLVVAGSNFGVTKDGSNFVSRVKDQYSPYSFRATTGKQPIENGNGFEFDGNNDVLFRPNPRIDWTKPLAIEFWLQQNIAPSGWRRLVCCYDGVVIGNLEFLFDFETGTGDLRLAFGKTTTFGTLKFTNPNLLNDTWYHILVIMQPDYSSGDRRLYAAIIVNGVVKAYTTPVQTGIVNTPNSNSELTFGATYTDGTGSFNGHLDMLRLRNENTFNIDNVAVDDTLFSPLTFPNTLL